uniref:Mechanosensitive ion channel protein 8-like n=1 Tax=Tanacetum cinerariifolium TaxID=118510 RepID=A0A6L2P1A5_TANCI|nr:mechanosensitive ion channel protein 8-like [Tanacetum cinerariifolium]
MGGYGIGFDMWEIEVGLGVRVIVFLIEKEYISLEYEKVDEYCSYGVLSTLDEKLEGSRRDAEDQSAVQIMNEHQAKVATMKIFIDVFKQSSKCAIRIHSSRKMQSHVSTLWRLNLGRWKTQKLF